MNRFEQRLDRIERTMAPATRIVVVDANNEAEVALKLANGTAPAWTIYVRTGVDRAPGSIYR